MTVEGPGFHARDNWFFRREDDGSVRIMAPDSLGPGAHQVVVLDASTWASVVAAVSAAGESGGSPARTWRLPHCDSAVLHAPGECEFCDAQPEWQELRRLWGIAFTGHAPRIDAGRPWLSEVPCPSDARRPGGANQMWPGNRPEASAPGD
ncbi:hypothetical protein ACGFIY_21305 [Micromonospora chersina]|uniref:hypothetical protein n=1 Tax=Micromonospora chersina TaxID=47854 RepID=UPI003720777D